MKAKVTKTKVEVKANGFKSISQLVVCRLSKDPNYDYDKLTKEVKQLDPKSKWQKTHYFWYKSALRSGRIKGVKDKIAQAPKKAKAQHA